MHFPTIVKMHYAYVENCRVNVRLFINVCRQTCLNYAENVDCINYGTIQWITFLSINNFYIITKYIVSTLYIHTAGMGIE